MIKVDSSGKVEEVGYNKKIAKPQKQEVDLNKLNESEQMYKKLKVNEPLIVN